MDYLAEILKAVTGWNFTGAEAVAGDAKIEVFRPGGFVDKQFWKGAKMARGFDPIKFMSFKNLPFLRSLRAGGRGKAPPPIAPISIHHIIDIMRAS